MEYKSPGDLVKMQTDSVGLEQVQVKQLAPGHTLRSRDEMLSEVTLL